jgi:hypothetical protein
MIVTVQLCVGAIIYFLWTPHVPAAPAIAAVEPP